jgi:hypothetical protein
LGKFSATPFADSKPQPLLNFVDQGQAVAQGSIVYPTGGVEQQYSPAQGCPTTPAKSQESDRLELTPAKVVKADAEKDSIPLVSLGCACGPKLAFKELGRGAETLPFDWIATTADGVIEFLTTGFQGFFDFTRKIEKEVAGAQLTVFRSHRHSFWHDDPNDASMRERYQRRIARLFSMDARTRPVLFVRLLANTEELALVEKLSDKLTEKFGHNAMLLVIVDCQTSNAVGPCIIEGLNNVLIHYLTGGDGYEKFCDPIDNALNWAARRPTRCVKVPTLKAACVLATPGQSGNYGMGGIPSFEGIPDIF